MKAERRTKTRYPLELNVRYQALGTGRPLAGVGQTVNISSGGLWLACQNNQVSEGTQLRATIEWPSLLDGSTPLQLVTIGTVIRRSESGFAVALDRYQFRTMGRRTNLLELPAVAGAGVAAYGRSGLRLIFAKP